MQINLHVGKELSESERVIADLEWEADTHRILFAQARALGDDSRAAKHDRIVRDLLDELTGLYGRGELERRVA